MTPSLVKTQASEGSFFQTLHWKGTHVEWHNSINSMNNWKLFLDTNLKFILYLENCSYNTILSDLSIYEIPVGVLVYCKIMSHSICNCKFYITDYRYSVLRRIDSINANSNISEKLLRSVKIFLTVTVNQRNSRKILISCCTVWPMWPFWLGFIFVWPF